MKTEIVKRDSRTMNEAVCFVRSTLLRADIWVSRMLEQPVIHCWQQGRVLRESYGTDIQTLKEEEHGTNLNVSIT